MSNFRKSLIAFFVAATFIVAPFETFAYETSGCGGCGGSYFETCVDRFNNKVDSYPGWSQVFSLGCSSCSEDYYKRSASGGSENSWIDHTDIHFRNSHCGSAWDSFWGKTLSSIPFTDGSVTPGEAYRSWGDYDLEWIASKCCSLLRDDSRAYWYTTFDGLHLMLGYKTSSYGYTDFGKIWAEKMRETTINILWWTFTIPSQTITQAWFNTTDETQPSGTTARVLAEVSDNYNDHLWGNGYVSPDPTYNGWYWYWDHVAGSPPYLTVNDLRTMNVYEVVPRAVDEGYVKQLGTAFGMDSADPVGDTCNSLVMADLRDKKNPRILNVSKATGHFYYQELGKLFVGDPTVGQFPPDQAVEMAESFLRQNDLLPADAGDFSVEFDALVEESDKGEERQRIHQNTNVVYARQIPGDPEQEVPVSVAGGGARLKVYLAPEDGKPMGAMGNWRNIKKIGEIPVNPEEETWSFFDKYREGISIVKAQVQYDSMRRDPQSSTQGYFEHSGRAFQTELIPCWIFQVEYFLGDELVLKADTFVPAAESYFPPVVDIIKPAEFATFKAGDLVGFDCLVEEGFGTPPYTYRWESDADGLLSTEKTFETDLLSVKCPDQSCDCSPLYHNITLTVNDAKGLQAEDSVQIMIEGECTECSDCADLNSDNIVDLKDLATWANRYLTQSIPGAE
jgi:hypothetical protein